MPFVRITMNNRVDTAKGRKNVVPGDVVEVHEAIANHLVKINYAVPLADPYETNVGESHGWMLEKT